jgi:hypothetical protein
MSVSRFFGGLLVLLGSAFLLFAVAALAASADPTGTIVLFVMGGILLGAGVPLRRSASSREQVEIARVREQAVLDVAAMHGGVVTVALAMQAAKLSARDAALVLEELCRQGVAEPELLDDGGVEYRIRGLMGSS